MAKAVWKDTVIAESETFELVEGNVYFPAESVAREHVRDSNTQTVCPWKGVASYYDVVVDGEVNPDAAWSYPEPKQAASQIRGHVAFWRGVTVER
ncbi:MAG: DUF427 domain-containing protein [Gemmatimonadetes bacterium]|nr:DUF427 domain-containing protein [Gemmatimonadota bacterium]MBT8478210.1 DUF427 domain-containing protein [Gemmatimonadota bacterium]NNK48573.1 DUF427 domain-containing protein [Gemmatimonadota bacterium]